MPTHHRTHRGGRCRPRGGAMMRLSLLALLAAGSIVTASAETRQTISLRGHDQHLHLYGRSSGRPLIVSSGDGGWIHLGPHVAEVLGARGYFVVGFDVKTYLESFTTGTSALRPQDEPGDYRVLAEFAARSTRTPPILIGISEGAGLSVLAATDPQTKAALDGVIAVGLPDVSELAWRWKDSLIYLTHKSPREPGFSTAAIVRNVAPVPLAAIHSTHDEFVSLAEVRGILEHAQEPSKLWVVEASNHRFSDNLPEFDRRLVDAIEWVTQQKRR